ncbi:phosphatase PAP2 family protein [Gaiella sp.]|jgi:membrane-associated phospholipid phosphatase|uniref:phosphatase PAP2 family protein n=1 Tax=Gaiella sp. TaxID=2663207 RepID=UPI002C361157|nr:phosphatase PAP2 family protein [Gaiella sp.]HWO82087.1 phosphatase PAP2 family protein [Gaiella sp.]
MPLLVLFLVAIAGGTLVALLASRYPTPVIGEEPSQAAGEKLAEETVKRPWLRRTLTRRLDPAAATGLALTIALGLAIVGGMVIGVLAYLMRSSGALVGVDNGAGQWGVDHATSWSTRGIQLVTDLGGTWFVIALAVVVCVVEYVRVPNRWIPVFLLTVLLGEVVLVNAIKDLLHRVRPTFNPIAETLGPSFPSGHSATAAAFYAAVALILARRRSPRTRSLLAGAAVAVAVGVAASRVLLGVHWLSDVVAGLAFGWGWFALCAIAFGGRFLSFGEPAEKAARVAERAEARSAPSR